MDNNFKENQARGWIKSYRSMEHWEWYTKPFHAHVFQHLLRRANHKQKRWRGNLINRGQLITSIEHLSNETGVSVQSVRTVLKNLKSTNEITTKGTNQNTTITICNYDSYQDDDREINQPINNPPNKPVTNNQQSTNNQSTTNKNVNNFKKLNNSIYKEILENSKDFFQKICDIHKINVVKNEKLFGEFFALNYSDNMEQFTAQNVRNHYKNSMKSLLKKPAKKPASKKPVTNRPE
jgi:hypothetical protein